MKGIQSMPEPRQPDASGVVSWAHIGDLHITARGEQNYQDLQKIVEDVNRMFVGSLNFVYLPGDQAEHGLPAEYELVRSALDRLEAPWFSILGDHDVQTRSFEPYHAALLPEGHYAFEVGGYDFIALNAFSKPAPDHFSVDAGQLAFLEARLKDASARRKKTVLLMHCYPSDLKQGYESLRHLIERYEPLLVDMGHTHYNEIARDAWSVYTATRSTGQIEEGPVGYSITSLDQGCVSWKFKVLEETGPFAMITHPGDWRLRPQREERFNGSPLLRARVWSDAAVTQVRALTDGKHEVQMTKVGDTNLWLSHLPPGEVERVEVIAETRNGAVGRDEVRRQGEARVALQTRDQDNAIGAWPERGIVGTQLGPNKNGRKW
jgi:hypothetical protein